MIWDNRYDDIGPALERGRATVRDLSSLTSRHWPPETYGDEFPLPSAIAPRLPPGLTPRLPLDVTPEQAESAATGTAWQIAFGVIACLILAGVSLLGAHALLAALS